VGEIVLYEDGCERRTAGTLEPTDVTVVGLDDTDSRTEGMCTTYAAALLADRVRAAGGSVERLVLVRLNPAVEHKTRGNAALAVHCDLAPDRAFALATDLVGSRAATGDPRTNPGVVVTDGDLGAAPSWVQSVARAAVRDHLDHETIRERLAAEGYRHEGWGNERGLVGATAAVGAWQGFRAADWPDDWTYECISYRERDRWGTDRDVDRDSVFAVADEHYPAIWDTVDRGESEGDRREASKRSGERCEGDRREASWRSGDERSRGAKGAAEQGEAVCVPNTPGPVLHGIRGDDRETVERAAQAIESESVERRATFVTNQGTDVHLRPPSADANPRDGRAYRLPAEVVDPPETRAGGHVFLSVSGDETKGVLPCVAFEPTKRFRDRVRRLRVGDRVTVCGEVADGTLKLEKFAVRDLRTVERVTPDCPECGRSMESAGTDAGYRCRDCGTNAPGKVERPLERDLERGWYEVPPCARRHIAKPLVRGGFDAPIHPER
jgi:tRNA(Ile2)-agmatinylcytidine synthase